MFAGLAGWKRGRGGGGGEEGRRGGGQATILFFFFLSILLGWSRAVMQKTFSVLSFLILTLERADFSFCFSWVSLLLLRLLSLLFLSPRFGISLSSRLLQLQAWDTWCRKKTQGTHHRVLSQVLRSVVDPPSPPHIAEPYVYFIYGNQGFKWYLVGRIGNVHPLCLPRSRVVHMNLNINFDF